MAVMRKILFSIILGAGGFIQTEAAAEAPSQVAVEHPFFRNAALPAWSRMTPEQLLADTRAAIQEARANKEALRKQTAENATFENTFLAYTRAAENMRQVQSYMGHLAYVRQSPELQKAQATLLAEHARYQGSEQGEEQVVKLLTRLAHDAAWTSKLTPSQQRLVEQTVKRFHLGGATLPPEKRLRKAEIEKELRKLALDFQRNLTESHKHWELVLTAPEQLKGMPESWMAHAQAAARAKGHGSEEKPAWLVNLTNSHAGAVLTQCEVEETRRQCWLGLNSTGTALTLDNEPIIYRTMQLRHELAQLLGFQNFADMQAQERMTGSGETALAFVDKLLQALKPQYDTENAAYLARLGQACGSKPLAQLKPWDEAYLAHRAPAPERPQFDASALRPYLECGNVLRGMFGIWEKLLGVQIQEQATACVQPGTPCPAAHVEVWHPSVRFFTVHDATTRTHLGSFYLDLYPRPDKRGDAWTAPLRFGHSGEPHLAVIAANITPPGTPHLLHHGDLYVLFHEFGHLMHMLLGHPELQPEHCAMSVERDFIEMPSQLQEQWIWEPEALATFARHHQTGAPLPRELAEALAASRRNASVAHTMQMLHHAKLDLEMNMYFHEKFEGKPLDTAAAELLAPWQLPYSAPTPSTMRTVHHTMHQGYAAGFYTYLWSEVLSFDAFTRFQKEGVMNPTTGAEYRRCILEPGGSRPALEIFRNFMGREPDQAAFLSRFAHP